MNRHMLGLSLLALLTTPNAAAQKPTYPPLSEYLMARDAEIALARSAAPEGISSHATVKILTPAGYQIATQGDNGFVCLVMRGWGAPSYTPVPDRQLVYDSKLRAPICLDPIASRTVLPLQEFRAWLGMEGKDPDAIAREVSTAYAVGRLPKMEGVAFGYMWSANQYLGANAGAWRPHMMIFAPYYTNAMLGGNASGGPMPFVGSDEGTPFAVIVVAVDGNTAIDSKSAHPHSR